MFSANVHTVHISQLNVYPRVSRRRRPSSSSSSISSTVITEGITVYNTFDHSRRHSHTTHHGDTYTTVNHNHSSGAEATLISEHWSSTPTNDLSASGLQQAASGLRRVVSNPCHDPINAERRQAECCTADSDTFGGGGTMHVGIINQTVNMCCENCLEEALIRARESEQMSRSHGSASPETTRSPDPPQSQIVGQSHAPASTLPHNFVVEDMNLLGKDADEISIGVESYYTACSHSLQDDDDRMRSILDSEGGQWTIELLPASSDVSASQQLPEQRRHSGDHAPQLNEIVPPAIDGAQAPQRSLKTGSPDFIPPLSNDTNIGYLRQIIQVPPRSRPGEGEEPSRPKSRFHSNFSIGYLLQVVQLRGGPRFGGMARDPLLAQARNNPRAGEESTDPSSLPNDINIGHLRQSIHYHPSPESSGKAWSLILAHVVAGAAHDFAERGDATGCHPKTRKAVQKEVVTWMHHGDEEPERMLWLLGPAGTGKTSIARTVADRCDTMGALAGSFFFSATSDIPALRSKKGLVTSLVFQLMKHDSIVGFKDEVLAAIDSHPMIFESSLKTQLEDLILEPLRKVQGRSDPSTWPKSFIIDGIDECCVDSSNASKILPASKTGAWTHLNRSSEPLPSKRLKDEVFEDIISILITAVKDPAFPFRIVVVSKPEPPICAIFSAVPIGIVRKLFLDEKYNPDADIRKFLNDKFARVRQRFGLPKTWPAEPVLAKLIRSASGQFISVSTVVRFIEAGSAHPQDLLDRVLELGGRQGQKCPLYQLDQLYTQIVNTSPDPVKAVTWIHAMLELHSGYNDTSSTLRAFFESQPGETEFLLRNLSALVGINEDGASLRFYHKSVMDFLASPKRCGDLYVDPETVSNFLQNRWYTVLKNRGPQIPMEAAERGLFLGQFVESFSMRYFYLPGGGENYTRADVVWWADTCSTVLSESQRKQAVKGMLETVHQSCTGRCHSDCKVWRKNLNPPVYRRILGVNRGRKPVEEPRPASSHSSNHRISGDLGSASSFLRVGGPLRSYQAIRRAEMGKRKVHMAVPLYIPPPPWPSNIALASILAYQTSSPPLIHTNLSCKAGWAPVHRLRPGSVNAFIFIHPRRVNDSGELSAPSSVVATVTLLAHAGLVVSRPRAQAGVHNPTHRWTTSHPEDVLPSVGLQQALLARMRSLATFDWVLHWS
ncbi:hypothetical protein NMY22_g5880 [Coprinellus aureogranulatus]|nr:hypothetical protein NMY22_g5880 [Coprinellus aureogranulatus]